MKQPFITFLMVAVAWIVISNGEELKCNSCKSSTSFEDCDKNIRKVQCAHEFGLTRCMKAHIKRSSVTEETYIRRCQTEPECARPTCKKAGDDMCEVFCCTGDYCNAASVKMVSGATLLSCVVLAFVKQLLA